MERHRLTIVVPAYNEERTIGTIMHRLHEACGFAELVFVDDGSEDATLESIKRHARPEDIILTKPNGGKGSAVRKGYEHASGAYTIVQDADLEYDPEEIPPLLSFAEQGNHDAVFGSRRLKKQKQFAHFAAFVGGVSLTWLCNLLYHTNLTDQPTCYKLVRTDVLKTITLKENDFRFDPELTVKLAKKGIRIAEFPISYHPRSIKEGKKINWKDWFRWVKVFVAERFTK